jgi:hypothetical protein
MKDNIYYNNSVRSVYDYTALVCRRITQYHFVSLRKTTMLPGRGPSRRSVDVDVQTLALAKILGRLPRRDLHHLIGLMTNRWTQSPLTKTTTTGMIYAELTQHQSLSQSVTPTPVRVSQTHTQEHSIQLALSISAGGS